MRMKMGRTLIALLTMTEIAACKTTLQKGRIATSGRGDPIWSDGTTTGMNEDKLLKYLYQNGQARDLTPEDIKDILHPTIPLEDVIGVEDDPVVNDLYPEQGQTNKSLQRKTLKLDDTADQDVDLRKFDTPVKNQFDTTMCTSFATNAAIENVSKKKTGLDLDLSERHLFSRYRELSTADAVKAAADSVIVPESAWPLQSLNPVQNLNGQGIASVSNYGYRLTRMSQIISELRDGNPLVIGISTTEPFLMSGGIVNKEGKAGSVGHAMTVVGFFLNQKFVNQGGGVLILKNSYGRRSGDNGYVYLPLDYCDVNAGRRCWAWAIRDVTLTNVDVPENNPQPAPSVIPAPQGDQTPAISISASDFKLVVYYVGWSGSQRIYQIALEGSPEKISAVKRVTFKIHRSYGADATYSTQGEGGVFSTDNYRTGARRWRTDGATVEGKGGEIFEMPGANISW